MRTPLENNFKLASSSEAEPPGGMFVGGTPLGFRIMVAPINQNDKAWNKLSPNLSQTRTLQGQLGGEMPPPGGTWPA